ncbi:hypothetical protein FE810_07380 [Thalassotalea litorea]|uniref:BNR repeat-containing family member n=1 Tax=Thalassotalea litorea TaxID=2020715 RepID=A0A5R9IMQ3_9GAMM|nr:BNR repeat-containing protein [Thalassotalea litorea]TLU65733.1 hypothetical protein FE810_07380 [Thalassotalea litorea]
MRKITFHITASNQCVLAFFLLLSLGNLAGCTANTDATVTTNAASDSQSQLSSLAIDNVWSGHRIKPYLLTRGKNQFVAYFDSNRQMTVAHRLLGKPWRYYKVDSWLGWDSHNYVTMELDSAGHLHVMGNMHGDAIEYFRTTVPMQVRSLKRVASMVNLSQEQRMTYPVFLLNKDNQLILKYRDGGSGNGNEIYNIYDSQAQKWSRLHGNTFLDGEGKMSGYFEGPIKGPDGHFHLIWVWRNTPNAATNHSLSYAKSPDLIHWSDSQGKPLALPITLKATEVVDPVPPFAGMINGNVKLGFDRDRRPIISYHKYDASGNTQMYVARQEGKHWKSVQISDWQDFRWDFSGPGSLGKFPIKPQSPTLRNDGNIGVIVRKHEQVMQFVLDPDTLAPIRVEDVNIYPPEIESLTEKANALLIDKALKPLEHNVFIGAGDTSSTDSKFYLSWHSQSGNRDRAHDSISLPSVLLLHEVSY